jgi:hypothetical protein
MPHRDNRIGRAGCFCPEAEVDEPPSTSVDYGLLAMERHLRPLVSGGARR